MLLGSDYERLHSLCVNLERGTLAQLSFFVLPTRPKRRGERKAKKKKKELTIFLSLLLVPGQESYCQAQMLYKPPCQRGDAATVSALTSTCETGG